MSPIKREQSVSPSPKVVTVPSDDRESVIHDVSPLHVEQSQLGTLREEIGQVLFRVDERTPLEKKTKNVMGIESKQLSRVVGFVAFCSD